jgi:hypothetical protein
MTDQLFLSLWLRPGARDARLSHFEKLLRLFPFSQRPQPQSTIAVLAIDFTNPPLFERPVNGPVDISEVMAAFRDFSGSDVAYQFESWWDLWQYRDGWKLEPARISLSCFGPDFDSGSGGEQQEDLRIDFGVDSLFLPQPELYGSGKLVESNIRSLLHLVHDIDEQLPVARRKLESESGENFADRLQRIVSAQQGNQPS